MKMFLFRLSVFQTFSDVVSYLDFKSDVAVDSFVISRLPNTFCTGDKIVSSIGE